MNRRFTFNEAIGVLKLNVLSSYVEPYNRGLAESAESRRQCFFFCGIASDSMFCLIFAEFNFAVHHFEVDRIMYSSNPSTNVGDTFQNFPQSVKIHEKETVVYCISFFLSYYKFYIY